MANIAEIAENFVRAASELIEAAGSMTSLDYAYYHTPRAHMTETQFNNLFGADGIEIKERDCTKYPIEKSITVGGIEFFCVCEDMEAWAKLKGYTKVAV